MEYLWLYLALSASFAGGFMVCAMLSWRQIELARRQAQRRIDILEAVTRWCLREVEELAKRREYLGLKVPPDGFGRHLRS